jgi:Ser/Thr protein kinase RdoA (MazF antagonist)
MVGERGFWGPWRAAIGLDEAGIAVLERALVRLRRRLEQIGESAEVFGLVHADLRLANLLVDGHHLRVIDFDDCGFSWYLYDFATAVSFMEHEPVVPALLRSWLEGYRKTLRLNDEAAADIPGFVILRRILLTAWLASHAEVPFAREFGADYTRGTVRLAQRWLDGDYLQPAC